MGVNREAAWKTVKRAKTLSPSLFTYALPRIYPLCMDPSSGRREDANTIALARWTRTVCRQSMAGCRTYHVAVHRAWLKEKSMTLKGIVTVLGRTGLVFSVLAIIPNNITHLTPVALAEDGDRHCGAVGGALMTNIGAIAGVTNLGPVSGDLAGSVAATILGQNSDGSYNVQHYWVTAGGETITLQTGCTVPHLSDQ